MNRTPLVILTALITAACTSLFWMGIGAIAFTFWMSNEDTPGLGMFMDDPFEVEVEAPAQVRVGETFTLKVKATNPADQSVTLNSIDIYKTLLDGFEIVRVLPRTTEVSSIFEFRSHYFNGLHLEAGESTTVTFELKAVKPGTWQGDIDCCTPMENFTSVTEQILVTAAAAQ